MKRPRVSIITVSYNRPELLKQAIDSVKAQTETDWELVIVDDGSSHKGIMPVLREAVIDKRIRAYQVNHINNLSMLWNMGLDLTNGKYVTTLDDDNMKAPEFCQKMADWLDNHPEYYSVACFAYVMNGDKITGEFKHPADINNVNIRKQNYVDSGCMMYRRELIDLIGYYDESLTTKEDWDFVIRAQIYTPHGFGVIPEKLFYYRWHGKNRAFEAKDLGDEENRKTIVFRKKYEPVMSVLLYHQQEEHITLSQNNVLQGIKGGLESLNYIKMEAMTTAQKPTKLYDSVFVFAPFSMNENNVEMVARHGQEVIHFHIEDPQAAILNQARARFSTYIVTNDRSVVPLYEEIVGAGKVCYCPSISFDDVNLKIEKKLPRKYKYDVIFYGYAYESRLEFIKQLKPVLKKAGHDLTVVGGGWLNNKVKAIDELSQADSLQLLNETKIVILHNRRKTDLGGSDKSITPASVVRGYFEIAGNALVMLDNERAHHSFDGEVVFYKDKVDLSEKIDYYLKHEKERMAIVKKAKKRVETDFTYRVRVHKVMNTIRSKRFFQEIL